MGTKPNDPMKAQSGTATQSESGLEPNTGDAAVIEKGQETLDEQKDTDQATIVEGAPAKTTLEAGDEDQSEKIADKETGALTEEALDADLHKDAAFVGEGDDAEFEKLDEDTDIVKIDEDTGLPVVARDPIEEGDNLVHQPGGTFRNKEDGKIAYAPPGTYNAAAAGVQQDASGHFESAGHVRSSKSGTRV